MAVSSRMLTLSMHMTTACFACAGHATLCRCADEMVDGKWNKFRDDVTHDGRKIDWGKWAITGNDPVFGGTGNPDTGAYGSGNLQPCNRLSTLQERVT